MSKLKKKSLIENFISYLCNTSRNMFWEKVELQESRIVDMSNCPKKTCTDWNAPVKAIFPLWTVPNHKCRTKSGCVKLRFVLFFRACECCDHGKKDMGIHSKQVQTFVISSECHHHQDNGVSTFSTPLWDVVFSIFNNLSSFEVCIIKVLSRDVFKEWQETSCFSSVWSRRVSTSDDHWSFWANVVPTSPPPLRTIWFTKIFRLYGPHAFYA